MAKKQDAFYFENFIACAEYSRKAAQLLKETLVNFKPEEMGKKMDEIHSIEHAADEKNHELLDALTKAFITPIEREDMMALGSNIDNLSDKIEEVFIRIYINNVQTIMPDAIALMDVVIQCCDEVCGLMNEFPNFRRSRKLHESIVRINSLEEDADRLFISSMRKLHTENKDILQILAWREIYSYLEKCADACEHVADIVGGVVMNNS